MYRVYNMSGYVDALRLVGLLLCADGCSGAYGVLQSSTFIDQQGQTGLAWRYPRATRGDQHLVLTTLPQISGVLCPEARVDLDLTWGMSAPSCWTLVLILQVKTQHRTSHTSREPHSSHAWKPQTAWVKCYLLCIRWLYKCKCRLKS